MCPFPIRTYVGITTIVLPLAITMAQCTSTTPIMFVTPGLTTIAMVQKRKKNKVFRRYIFPARAVKVKFLISIFQDNSVNTAELM